MSYEQRILDVSFEAAEDLTNDQFRFVVLSNGAVRRPDGAAERALGVLQNRPAQGQAASVRVGGISKLVAGAALSENACVKLEYVSATDAGKGLPTTTANDAVRGVVVQPASAEDDLAAVLLVNFNY